MADRPHCNATSKSTGSPCQKLAVPGSTKCRYHGGRTPVGIASPQFRTGRYSRHLPVRLVERYQEAAGDPELLALRDDIALLDARLADLLGRVDSGESGARWSELVGAWRAYRGAGSEVDALKARVVIDALIDAAASDLAAWAEIHVILEQRRKLVESEQKRLVAMQQMVTTEQAMTFVAALQASIRKHVTDPGVLRAIAADMAMLTHHDRPAA